MVQLNNRSSWGSSLDLRWFKFGIGGVYSENNSGAGLESIGCGLGLGQQQAGNGSVAGF